MCYYEKRIFIEKIAETFAKIICVRYTNRKFSRLIGVKISAATLHNYPYMVQTFPIPWYYNPKSQTQKSVPVAFHTLAFCPWFNTGYKKCIYGIKSICHLKSVSTQSQREK